MLMAPMGCRIDCIRGKTLKSTEIMNKEWGCESHRVMGQGTHQGAKNRKQNERGGENRLEEIPNFVRWSHQFHTLVLKYC